MVENKNLSLLVIKVISILGLILGVLMCLVTLTLLAQSNFHCFDADCLVFAIGYLVIAGGVFLIIFNYLLLRGINWAGYVIAYPLLLVGIFMFFLEPSFLRVFWLTLFILGLVLLKCLSNVKKEEEIINNNNNNN